MEEEEEMEEVEDRNTAGNLSVVDVDLGSMALKSAEDKGIRTEMQGSNMEENFDHFCPGHHQNLREEVKVGEQPSPLELGEKWDGPAGHQGRWAGAGKRGPAAKFLPDCP